MNIFTLVSLGLAGVAIAVIFFKLGYSSAKKNVMVHAFKEKMISSEDYHKLDKTDI